MRNCSGSRRVTRGADPARPHPATNQKANHALPPEAIARAIAFSLEQPPEVDLNEIVIRPTAQR